MEPKLSLLAIQGFLFWFGEVKPLTSTAHFTRTCRMISPALMRRQGEVA